MTVTLDTDDLLTRLTKQEMDELTATAIEAGQTDPVQAAIDGGLGEITVSIDPDALEAVSAAMLHRVWLSLAVPLLYPRRAVLPAKHKEEQTWAREFLERARKGGIRHRTIEVLPRDAKASDSATRDKLNGLT